MEDGGMVFVHELVTSYGIQLTKNNLELKNIEKKNF